MTKIVREYTLVEPGKISFRMHMGQGHRDAALHLTAELTRVEDSQS